MDVLHKPAPHHHCAENIVTAQEQLTEVKRQRDEFATALFEAHEALSLIECGVMGKPGREFLDHISAVLVNK